MTVPFALVTTQRTGSTWVIDSLDSHPELAAYSELFLDGRSGTPDWGARDILCWHNVRRRGSGDPGDDRVRLRGYLDVVYRARRGVAAAGFKLMYGQVGAIPGLLEELQDRGARLIHLVRENVLDVVVSREVAWERDLYHLPHGEREPTEPVHLETEGFVRKLEETESEVRAWRRRLEGTGLSIMELRYEDLQRRPKGFHSVLRFLGVREIDRPLRSTMQKVLSRDRSRSIANFEEVERVLSGTRWARLLHESPRVAAGDRRRGPSA